MFLFFNALAKWSKILIFKMDIFTNVLRKIFVKGSMHLIYEFNLILFHNHLFFRQLMHALINTLIN